MSKIEYYDLGKKPTIPDYSECTLWLSWRKIIVKEENKNVQVT